MKSIVQVPTKTSELLSSKLIKDCDKRTILRPREAAAYINISLSRLAKLRMPKERVHGPAFVKVGGCVLYRMDDIDAWLGDNVVSEGK